MQETNITLIIFLTCVLLIGGMVSFIAWLLYYHRKKLQTFQKNLESVKITFEKENLKAKLEMQDQVFEHMSREMHDNIGQFISLAKLHLNTIDLNEKDLSQRKIIYSTDLLTKAIDDLRDLSKSLSSEQIRHEGLGKAIDEQISQLRKTSRYEVFFETRGNQIFLDEQKEIFIFRILQEALNNVMKHSQASKIKIVLDYGDQLLEVLVIDNGRGFDTSAIRDQRIRPGGITNMMLRTKLIGGNIEIESSQQNGTTVRVFVPINTELP